MNARLLPFALSALVVLSACGSPAGVQNDRILRIDVEPASVELLVGATLQLTATVVADGDAGLDVTWTSGDETVVVVSTGGLLVGIAAGTTSVTARSVADPDRAASVPVTVADQPGVVAVTIDQADQALPVTRSVALTATVVTVGEVDDGVTWTSSDPAIASIDDDGTLTGHVPGRATVTARSVHDEAKSDDLVVDVLSLFVDVSAGNFHTLAIDHDGQAWAWGFGNDGQLGSGASPDAQATPVAVAMAAVRAAGATAFVDVEGGGDFSLALDDRGRAWAWGGGALGQLGNGTNDGRTTPYAVDMTAVLASGATGFSDLSAGNRHVLALDDVGGAWAWGYGQNGRLGLGDTDSRFVPVAIPMGEVVATGATRFVRVAAGGSHSVALDDLGQAWAWGEGSLGALGTGTKDERTLPTPVVMTEVTASGATGFVTISAGLVQSLAIDDLGRGWAWGFAGSGQLGNGDRTLQVAPVEIDMSLVSATFVELSAGSNFAVARSSDDRTWAWGEGGDGELGDGAFAESFVPVEVGGGPFVQVDGGSYHSVALDGDGQAWTWGRGQNGQLGTGDVAPAGEPTPVAMP